MINQEIFLPFLSDYLVGNCGTVYKIIRSVKKNIPHEFKKITIDYRDTGFTQYSYFTTYLNGVTKNHSLTKVMAQLFLGTTESCKYTEYVGQKCVNTIDNIRWKKSNTLIKKNKISQV